MAGTNEGNLYQTSCKIKFRLFQKAVGGKAAKRRLRLKKRAAFEAAARFADLRGPQTAMPLRCSRPLVDLGKAQTPVVLLPNGKIGSNRCHVLRLPPQSGGNRKTTGIKLYYFRILNLEIIQYFARTLFFLIQRRY